MRVTLEISGGFFASPALNGPFTIDTSTIDPVHASEVEAIVDDVRFFELPAHLNATAPGAADHFEYTITARDGEQVHSVILVDPISDVGLAQLITLLRNSA